MRRILGASGETRERIAGEVARARERVYSMSSHNLFGNTYVDFDIGSRFTPHLSFGLGAGLRRRLLSASRGGRSGTAFRASGVLDQLRSHPPNYGRDGSWPVTSQHTVEGVQVLGVTVELKYYF